MSEQRALPRRRITRLLVANRGEVATRIFRTARDLGIGTVAVYSEPDARLPFVSDADVAVPLRGSTAAQTYLDVDQLLAAAHRTGADAVHPGYGFLAESPAFARAVVEAGLVWVGPAAATIEQLGSKLGAKRVAQRAGVPLAPSAPLNGDDPQAWLDAVRQVGFPLLVKASAGGGGRGMRVVEAPADLEDAVQSARREAQAAFGDATVFAERYLRGARHVEVQLLGDEQGSVVHLLERECSIQRRHQKIVEESPSPGTSVRTLKAMCAAAVALGREVGFVGVGTVEFLVVGEGERQDFFFLEMNTRLQVEHAVTEQVVRHDMVRLQLVVAEGLPHGLEDGGWERWPDEVVDLDDVGADAGDTLFTERSTHAVEARLYAEDPAAGYRPSTGKVLRFEPPDDDSAVRWDCTVRTGSVVSPYYDALLAKVVAVAESRDEAVGLLVATLRGWRVHGVRTNRDQLVAILESEPFRAGGTPTDFLDLFPELVAPLMPPDVEIAHVAAAVLHGVRLRQAETPWPFVPPGWRNVPSGPETVAYQRQDGSTVDVAYDLRADGSAWVSVDGVGHEVATHPADDASDELVDAVVDGVRRRCAVAVYPDAEPGPLVCVDGGGWSTQWLELPRFPGAVARAAVSAPSAPVPGTVAAVLVAPGEHVAAGQTLVVLESMKMEHRVVAVAEGVVDAVHVQVGQSVDAHDVLVSVTAEAGGG